MTIGKWLMLTLSFLLTGCELVNRYKIVEVKTDQQALSERSDAGKFCIDGQADPLINNNCELTYWLSYWVENNDRTWAQRKDKIKKLGTNTFDQFRKVLLSQGKGTPYQDRLRAQTWMDELHPKLSPWMQRFVKVLVYQPSQEMLEFESALTILSRVNGNQAAELESLMLKIQEQQQQIEQLLKIEASMMEKREGINQ